MLREFEECRTILLRNDANTLERRAKRLSLIPVITISHSTMPNRISYLLSEAAQCFINGLFNGCVAVLAMAAEYALKRALHQEGRPRLKYLINLGKEQGVLDDREARALLELNEYRNEVIHSNLDALSSGVTLKQQSVTLTETRVVSTSDWEEFEPRDEDVRDIAASFAAESRMRDLLLNVREILYRLFAEIQED